MPFLSLHLHPSVHKIPFKFMSLYAFSTNNTYSITNAQFNLSATVQGFLSLLQKYSKSLIWVKSIHAQIITNCVAIDQSLGTKLIRTYSDLSSLDDARSVFDQFSQPRTFLCNAMLSGYLRNERHRETLDLFRMMGSCNLEFDSYTFNYALKACMGLSDYEMGMEVIKSIVCKKMDKEKYLASLMINFLVKLRKIGDARRVFDMISERDVVCWNSMIGGYVQSGQFDEVFDMFFRMRDSGITPSPITMVSLIQACGRSGDMEIGKCVHGCVLEFGMGEDTFVLSALVDMYSNMGDIGYAHLVFETMPMRNLVSWNTMISGCIQNGLVHESFSLFRRLVTSGCGFDSGTIVSLIQGCALTADMESGKILHGCVIRRGFELNLIISTAIIDLYSKCGAIEQATFVFDRMKERNVITWTAMLVGLAQNGSAGDAMKLFHRMQAEGVVANSVTLVSLVHSCAYVGSPKEGRSTHAYLIRRGYTFDIVVTTALIDMYAKCGKINSAEMIFSNSSIHKDVILYNSMITGYGIHGHGHQAVDIYRRMKEEGVKPNETSFLSLLTACSHSGLVEEGINLFHSMERDHNIKPTQKHYASIVDLLSRAGRFKEAEAFIEQMPFEPGSSIFEALLNGCQTHKNIDLGIKTADKLLGLESMNPGIYVVLSNIYAQARKWDAVNYVRSIMRIRGLKKIPGYSLIEVGNQVYTFFAGDDSHPNWVEIHQYVENLRLEVEACGYVADTSCVLRDVDEAMKIKLLWGHSERLAIAFGLLSTPAGTSIRITKNLRVCVDCHNVTKYISKIVRRELIVRDANRFHLFVNGKCSCNDYW
ncbi:pentatricopeptide repeat-containing protein At3g12770-like [Ziziphus jujuba]|uniref:Pentatricopeptide repeat-containing protein At3g12770-like n=1 Tax=Ziziphus jujuba TaxID=326968 RepID=A0A6P3Z424_ZIZJJ|nr:pentatricopeptide repeat-containing protein At3g12770-like [Ziziphus jujuba]XP_024925176.3 pentatricopeptide repeat-containing protein At3g12770-like [Ziziphus jujuba]